MLVALWLQVNYKLELDPLKIVDLNHLANYYLHRGDLRPKNNLAFNDGRYNRIDPPLPPSPP